LLDVGGVGYEIGVPMSANPTLTLPFAGEGTDRAGSDVCVDTPSPAIAGEGWDGGVVAASIAPIPTFPRCRGKGLACDNKY